MTSEFVEETYKESNDISENIDIERDDSDSACELKFSDINTGSDDEDETNRLITLRSADYMDIVDNNLKLVIAREGYPKLKMRLQQLQLFQKCLTEVIDMQVKNGLLKRIPTFVDYYLNRGAIVCICKDDDTRDWIVRISPGLEERMATHLFLLKANLKRLCLAVLKIPSKSLPASAREVFELLQYFNPTLNTNLWKIYAQKVVDNVEYTYFLIDRVSAEIIRGSSFKNVIDYTQMDFELAGYTEIYYECLLSSMPEDLRSVASRVKLLKEIRSGEPTPRTASDVSIINANNASGIEKKVGTDNDNDLKYLENPDEDDANKEDVKTDMGSSFQHSSLTKLEDAQSISDNQEVVVWSDEAKTFPNDYKADNTDQIKCAGNCIVEENMKCTSTSDIADSDKTIVTESLDDSNNLIVKSSNFDITSNRGIAYYRRTNYLHIDNELKVAITLEGYPRNKIDGTQIRRLKQLFKEYLNKDMKMKRFANLIIPTFHDVYLTNGALVYVCDSMETKDYLTEILPKLINSSGLKLVFRDLNSLVRYTRVIMQLSKEHAHVASADLLRSLQSQYPGLKPDCWKHYSDVVGKQKRQFGIDHESLEVINNSNFNPIYEGETLTFRIIDRQRRDVSFKVNELNEEENCTESKQRKEAIAKCMYIPLNPEIVKSSLKKIRANHYIDLIADDFKLYVSPVNYPETRIDEALFHTIKRTFENIVCDCIEKGDFGEEDVPKFYDIYLFDGVVFIISKDMPSRLWVERNVANVNEKLNLQLKSTEFRGAVGIVNMVIETSKNTDEVLEILQAQNPSLRTKFWRETSVAKSKSTLDVVLQIDKVSAQVITSPKFNKLVEGNSVEFKLGHLQSLLKPKASLEELTKAYVKKMEKRNKKVAMQNVNRRDKISEEDANSNLDLKSNQVSTAREENDSKITIQEERCIIYNDESKTNKCDFETEKLNELAVIHQANIKTYLEIPVKILPDRENCLHIIFSLLEYKNPGLNTELWKVSSETDYPGNGKFILYIDKQSLYIIESRNFDPTIGGEILRFSF